MAQAEALDKMLSEKGTKIDHVILLVVDEEALLERIRTRIEQSGQDARSDDNEKTLKNRLSVYHEQTAPVLPYFEEKGLIRKIDGMQPIETVSGEIKALLK